MVGTKESCYYYWERSPSRGSDCAAPRRVLLARAKVPFGSLFISCSSFSSLALKISCLAAMVPGHFMKQFVFHAVIPFLHSMDILVGTLLSSLCLKALKAMFLPLLIWARITWSFLDLMLFSKAALYLLYTVLVLACLVSFLLCVCVCVCMRECVGEEVGWAEGARVSVCMCVCMCKGPSIDYVMLI